MSSFVHGEFTLAPAYFQELLELRIHKRLNRHTKMYVRGIVREEEADRIAEYANAGQDIAFSIKTPEKAVVLFSGIISSVQLFVNMNVREAIIDADGYTALMDVKKKERSFQDINMPYESLFEEITIPYGDVMDMVTNGTPIGNMILQYQETDWNLVKRMASHFEAQLTPADGYGKPRYYVGRPRLNNPTPLDSHHYEVINYARTAARKIGNGLVSFVDQDAIVYKVRSNSILELGSQTVFDKRTMVVSEIETVLEDSVIRHTYTLCSENGTSLLKDYNQRIIGVSLFGNVTDVRRDLIKLKLDIDTNNPACGEKWFPFSTVYSSPAGNGWYAMPEIGDRVRLTCPNYNEANAYTASAVDVEASNPNMRAIPAHKIMHNREGKYIVFKPDMIAIGANDGTLIEMRDDQGILVKSKKYINIEANENLSISSSEGNINIKAKEIHLSSVLGGSVSLDENVKVTGAEVKMQ